MIWIRLLSKLVPSSISSGFTARSRITFGLACLLLSVLSAAMMFGMIPNEKALILKGRSQLCESLALSSTDYIARGDINRLESILRAIVQRNEDLESAGVRRHSGELVCEVGDHQSQWRAKETQQSTPHQVLVPIRSGGMDWGTVELRFVELERASLFQILSTGVGRMTIFLVGTSYIVFFFYLGKMLQQLDPSKSVPKRVRAALDSLAEGLLVIDKEGRIVLANLAFASWIDKSPDRMIGSSSDLLPWCNQELGLPNRNTPWVDALEQQRAIASVMMGLRDANGDIRILMANASPVLGQDGEYRGVLVSFDDVTQLEETKRNLDEAKKVAEEANQAKSDFLAQMSHEIRTPMNAILGYTDVMRRGFDESERERQEYLNTIHASGEHLLALINDILDLSKIEAGHMTLEIQPCSIHEILQQIVSVLKVKSDEKGIELRLDCYGKLPETIQSDPVRLRQAVMNLAGNAIKFTEQGSVTIRAEMLEVRSESGQAMMAIHVIDTGIGISEESQKKIFDPFSQADNSITRRFGGTGLGLSISKQLCEAMGGNISLQSQLGQGSRFTMRFEIGDADPIRLIDVKDWEGSRTGTTDRISIAKLPSCRILVADDGVSNRKLVRLVLSRAGATVIAVENGAEAVTAALQEPFDVILMDMQMPVLDGYSATRELRNRGYRGPIYALTANAMQGDEQKCREAGCSGFMTKPLVIDKLLATIAEELSHRTGLSSEIEQDVHREIQQLSDVMPTETKTILDKRDGDADRSSHPHREEEVAASSDEAELGNVGPVYCALPMDDVEFREIAEEFVRRLDEQLGAMEEALSQERYVDLAKLAHWLKGAGGTSGFDHFTEPAMLLELAAKSSNSKECQRWYRQAVQIRSNIDLSPTHSTPI